MPAQRRLKPSEKQQIISARLSRVPLIEISNRTNISYFTVKYTWSQYEKCNFEKHDLFHQNGLCKISEDQNKKFYRYIKIRNDMPWFEFFKKILLLRTLVC